MTSCATPGPSNLTVHSPVRNSAPVLDFRCLFTRDLIRKQKRWQDGRLKFHTFNKRIIVHDEKSNLVGDSHWQEDGALEEGTELSLERSGVLVEVGEYMGKRDQNLDELLDKRIREREKRAAAKIASGTPQRFSVQSHPSGLSHLRSKALNTMLASSKKFEGLTVLKKPELKDRQDLSPAYQRPSNHDYSTKRRKLDLSPSERVDSTRKKLDYKGTRSSFQPPTKTLTSYEAGIGKVKSSLKQLSPATIDLTIDDKNQTEIESQLGENIGDVHRSTKTKRKVSTVHPGKSNTGYANQLTGASLTLNAPHKKYASRLGKNGTNSVLSPTVQRSKYGHSITYKSDKSTSATFHAENSPKLQAPAKILAKLSPEINKLDNFSNHTTGNSPKFARVNPSRNDQITNIPRIPSPLEISHVQSPSPGISRIRPPSPEIVCVLSPSPGISRIRSYSADIPCVRSPSLDLSCAPSPSPEISRIRSPSPVTKITSNRLKSTLRIKSRPPRKMLSLGISSSHALGQSHPLVRKNSSRNFAMKPNIDFNQLESIPSKNIMSSVSSNSSSDSITNTMQIISRKNRLSRPGRTEKCDTRYSSEVPITESIMASREISNENAESEMDLKCPGFCSIPSDKVSSPRAQCYSNETRVFEQRKAHNSASSITDDLLDDVLMRESRFEVENQSPPIVSNEEKIHQEIDSLQSVIKLPSGGIQTAKNRFKAMINRLGKGTNPVENTGPDQFSKPKRLYTQFGGSVTPSDNDHGNDNAVISETGKMSPSPSPILIPSSQKSCDAGITDSHRAITTSNSPVILASGTPKKPPDRKPQVKLANPATRGISLLTIAASTKDALNKKTTMAPSSVSPRSENSEPLYHDDDPFDAVSNSLEKRTPATGPWSRESFDLLGDLKVPGMPVRSRS
ncbi:hypothetical protein K3495_g6709 [Podosphaera aphanis]|nr:hypothetical protein K3495_g6709 [Podosphaera aphanis]